MHLQWTDLLRKSGTDMMIGNLFCRLNPKLIEQIHWNEIYMTSLDISDVMQFYVN